MDPRYRLASTLYVQEQVLSIYKKTLISAFRNYATSERMRWLRLAYPLRFCFLQRVGNSLLRFDQPPTIMLCFLRWRPTTLDDEPNCPKFPVADQSPHD